MTISREQQLEIQYRDRVMTDQSARNAATAASASAAAAAAAVANMIGAEAQSMVAGVVTLTGHQNTIFLTIDTSGGVSENLTAITGGFENEILIIKSANNARTVVVKDGAGMALDGDYSLSNTERRLTLVCKAANSWEEMDRSHQDLAHARQHSVISTSDHTSTATSGKILKANANGLPVDATNTDTELSTAVTKTHDKQHSITSGTDHTSTATPGKMLKADANGLPIDATNTDTEVSTAVTKTHDRQHAITDGSDHTSTATSGQILKADANGLPVDASNSDTEVADAVSKAHTQGSDTTIGILTSDVAINDAAKGLVLKDTQATPHYWRITISNVGALVITDIGTAL